MPVLVAILGDREWERFELPLAGPCRIGRSPRCEIALSDPGVSKNHCAVEHVRGSWTLRDLGSLNGTFVNGVQIREHRLETDDEIRVGGTTFRFDVAQIPEGRPKPMPTPGESSSTAGGADAVPDRMLGRTLGQYRLLSCVGRGGMGDVYRGVHVATGQTVAVKVFRADLSADRDAIRRFVRSARTAVTLFHPNLVAVHDVDHARGVYFLVMEFVDGRDLELILDDLAPGQGMRPGPCVHIAAQIASALEYAHQNGIVHRDVKPGNILLRADHIAKLTDVCLLKAMDESGMRTGITRSGMTMGTIDYMPPEQILDAKRVDHRADIYALGATLYHMLAGSPAFPDARRSDKIQSVLAGEARPLRVHAPGLPDELYEAVETAMATQADQRYPTAAAMLRGLERTGLQLDGRE